MKKRKALVLLKCEYNYPGCSKDIHTNEFYYENTVPKKDVFNYPIGLYNPTIIKNACLNCAKIIKPQKPKKTKQVNIYG